MKLHLTTLVLCPFARGFSPAEGFSRARGIFRPHRVRTSIRPATTSTTSTTGTILPTPTNRINGERMGMVLRPDWERDGRVFGFKPSDKKGGRAFEYLVEYPCNFAIKVIGLNEGSFATDIAATVSEACEVETEEVRYTVRDTSSGKYQSVTVHAPVKSASMLYRCYERIDEDPRVKFKF